jgi:hypothetical protein
MKVDTEEGMPQQPTNQGFTQETQAMTRKKNVLYQYIVVRCLNYFPLQFVAGLTS